MVSDKHEEIRQFMAQAAGGNMPAGKKLIFNSRTGKFEVRSSSERPGDDIPQVDASDMTAFGPRGTNSD
jgi:hypothetical protein